MNFNKNVVNLISKRIMISWGFPMRAIFASSLQGSNIHIVPLCFGTYFTLFVINFNNPT